MAQTKRKRRTKHRGTAAGTIQTRGRTGRPLSTDEKKKASRLEAREKRLNSPPTWKASITRAAIFALFALVLYIPAGYYIELMMYRRRMQKKRQAADK